MDTALPEDLQGENGFGIVPVPGVEETLYDF